MPLNIIYNIYRINNLQLMDDVELFLINRKPRKLYYFEDNILNRVIG